ncbi:MAG: protease modulator HflC, partial [Gammaproteobacteria bacterium]|nr:protease modulator HflC [Gammaproteobacteria bacterium]
MKLSYLLISLGIGMAVGLSAMMYTVDQTDEAIVLHLGEIKLNAAGQPMTEGPGLHFKSPFVTSVQSFDMRLRNLNIDSSRIVTSEQKDVIVDAFVKWRINDIVAYYKATGGDELVANKLLSQKVSDDLRAEFGK